MYTRSQWAKDVLIALGNKEPSPDIVSWLSAWTTFETPAPTPAHVGALYNLLNTTLRENGSTDFNSAGVQDFPSYPVGIEANAVTISNGFYPHLHEGLRTNEIEVLKNHPMVNLELSRWGTGSKQAAINVNAMLGTGLDDQFPGNVNPNQRVPEGWKDDGTILTAPNKIQVRTGFRDYILSNDWDNNDMPLNSEYADQSLEISNPSTGAGTAQDFRMSRLLYTQRRGVFKGWVGQEYLAVKAMLVKDEQQDASGTEAPVKVVNSNISQ